MKLGIILLFLPLTLLAGLEELTAQLHAATQAVQGMESSRVALGETHRAQLQALQDLYVQQQEDLAQETQRLETQRLVAQRTRTEEIQRLEKKCDQLRDINSTFRCVNQPNLERLLGCFEAVAALIYHGNVSERGQYFGRLEQLILELQRQTGLENDVIDQARLTISASFHHSLVAPGRVTRFCRDNLNVDCVLEDCGQKVASVLSCRPYQSDSQAFELSPATRKQVLASWGLSALALLTPSRVMRPAIFEELQQMVAPPLVTLQNSLCCVLTVLPDQIIYAVQILQVMEKMRKIVIAFLPKGAASDSYPTLRRVFAMKNTDLSSIPAWAPYLHGDYAQYATILPEDIHPMITAAFGPTPTVDEMSTYVMVDKTNDSSGPASSTIS